MKKRSKYNVAKDKTKRTCDGIEFDSELEKRFYCDIVKTGVKTGKISEWKRQVKFVLQPSFKRDGKNIRAIDYKADFVITYDDGHTEVIDIKGMATPEALFKRKMFWYVYPNICYRWIGYSKLDSVDGTGWADYDAIKAGRRARKKQKEKKELKENGSKKRN